jgi:hypothetical protein
MRSPLLNNGGNKMQLRNFTVVIAEERLKLCDAFKKRSTV